MINHIQTLLLNESASIVQASLPESEYGYIDPAYAQVALDSAVTRIYSELFFENPTLSDKLRLVKLMLPYFYDPEFADAFAVFDQRVIAKKKVPESVFDFYTTLEGVSGILAVDSTVSSVAAPSAFLPTTEARFNDLLPKLQKVYATSKETTKRFSALLFAIAFHLEAARLKSAT